MVKLANREALAELRNSLKADLSENNRKLISLCAGSGCGAYGTTRVHEKLMDEIQAHDLDGQVDVKLSGCHGFCEKGPIMVIHPEGIFYSELKEEHIAEIVEKTIKNGELVKARLFKDPLSKKKITREEDIPFYKLQQRQIFGHNGLIDPTRIEDYIAVGGFTRLWKRPFFSSHRRRSSTMSKNPVSGVAAAAVFPPALNGPAAVNTMAGGM